MHSVGQLWSELLYMFVYWSPVSMTTSYQLKEIQDLIFMSVEFNKVLFN